MIKSLLATVKVKVLAREAVWNLFADTSWLDG